MMNFFNFPAFRINGLPVQLAEALAVIPENDLAWAILEFNGVGEAPGNLSMGEFEKLAHKTPGGFMISWNDLKNFSGGLHQTIDCLIVGARAGQDILEAQKAGDDFSSCEIVIEIFDSTEWRVWARSAETMERLSAVY